MINPAIVRVAVPSPLRRTFDYLIGAAHKLQPGMRVKVPFGRKQVVGMVVELTDHSDLPTSKLKSIIAVVDESPLFPPHLFELILWAADYYQYPLGEVLAQAMPILLRQGQPAEIAEETYWRLTSTGEQTEFKVLKRAPKQWQALQKMRELATLHSQHAQFSIHELKIFDITPSLLKILKEKKLVEEAKDNKIKELPQSKLKGPILSVEQAAAVAAISKAADTFTSFLLQGITGSGKTEVYLSVLEKLLIQGGQALILVPEIGLTPQTVARFRERLSDTIELLHSGLSDKDRCNSWLLAKNGDISVIIGTRSAIFTPFSDLKCIIVDEAHDVSFKQWEGFKYNARDLALRRAQLEQIPIILGSATPSLTNFYQAQQNKMISLTLHQRAGVAVLPQFRLVDMRHQALQQGIALSVLEVMRQHLSHGNQILVFLNRRGFAPVLLCHDCGWVAECDRCHIALTKHFSPLSLQCHHCGKLLPLPKQCKQCDSRQLIDVGLGTERVEQMLQRIFPAYKIARIDRDSTRRKGSLENKLQDIHQGHAQILIGTQMLAKGHHFPNVTLVVMLDADSGLYSADFYASERMAQLILQVAGRAGRAEKAGEVLIQTHHPEHPLLKKLIDEGYSAFAEQTLQERKAANLPPFSHLVLITAEAGQSELGKNFLTEVKQIIELQIQAVAAAEITLFGPMLAPIEKRAGRYRWQLILSAQQRSGLHHVLKHALLEAENLKSARKVRWSVDVDPVEML